MTAFSRSSTGTGIDIGARMKGGGVEDQVGQFGIRFIYIYGIQQRRWNWADKKDAQLCLALHLVTAAASISFRYKGKWNVKWTKSAPCPQKLV